MKLKLFQNLKYYTYSEINIIIILFKQNKKILNWIFIKIKYLIK